MSLAAGRMPVLDVGRRYVCRRSEIVARPEENKLAHSPVNTNTRPDFSESFHIARDRAPDDPDIVNQKPLVGLNRWPEDMPELRAATTSRSAPRRGRLDQAAGGAGHVVVNTGAMLRCVGPNNPPRYEPTIYGAFTERLLTLNFAHRQAGGSGESVG